VAVGRIAAGGMMATCVAMRDQNGVVPISCETAIGFVDDRHFGHDGAVGNRKIAQGEKPVVNRADILGAQRRRVAHRDLPLSSPAIVHARCRLVIPEQLALSPLVGSRYTGWDSCREEMRCAA